MASIPRLLAGRRRLEGAGLACACGTATIAPVYADQVASAGCRPHACAVKQAAAERWEVRLGAARPGQTREVAVNRSAVCALGSCD